MRIAYYVHGRGRGHASRSSAVMGRLRGEGFEISACGGGDAEAVLCTQPDYTHVETVAPGPGLLRRVARRFCADRARLSATRPDCVISDGDMPSVLAARSLGIPVVGIGHDLVFSRCRLPSDLCARSLWKQRGNAFHTGLIGAGVAVNFVPLEGTSERFVVARPDIRAEWEGSVRRQGHIVAYFRDANGAPVLEELVRAGRKVILYGACFDAPAGVEVRPFDVSSFARTLASADAAVGSSGSNLIAECLALGIPMLALYREDDAEQRLNAGMLEASNAGVGCSFDEVSSRCVHRFLRRVDGVEFSRVDMSRMVSASDAMVSVLRGL